VSLDADCKEKMEEVMISWRDRGRGGNALDGGGSSSTADGDVSLPLGPGEWEEALGLPLCVVCQNVWTLKFTPETLLIFKGGPNRDAGEGEIVERRRV
jgi:hypothetical protein